MKSLKQALVLLSASRTFLVKRPNLNFFQDGWITILISLKHLTVRNYESTAKCFRAYRGQPMSIFQFAQHPKLLNCKLMFWKNPISYWECQKFFALFRRLNSVVESCFWFSPKSFGIPKIKHRLGIQKCRPK